jgi:hypothetical protein
LTDVHILAIDLAKRSFRACATAVGGADLFNRMVSRAKVETVLREQTPSALGRRRRTRRAISSDGLRKARPPGAADPTIS